MAVLEFQTEINAPPEDVFSYVSDLEKHVDWSGGQEIKKISEGPPAVGSAYETKEEGPFGMTFREKVEVIEHQPSARFGWRSYGPFGSWYDWSFEVRAQDGGAVLVERLDSSHGLPAAIALKLFVRRQMQESMPQGLAKIKKRVEVK
jgi:uncharacterized protein YndB with AHSA1/START domain